MAVTTLQRPEVGDRPQQEDRPRIKGAAWRRIKITDPVALIAHWGSVLMLLGMIAAASTPSTALLVAAAVLVVLGIRKLGRRFPEMVLTVLSTAAVISGAVLAAAVLGPLFVEAGTQDMGSAFLLAPLVVAGCAWLVPHRGVDRGWSVVVGHLPVWAGMLFMASHPDAASISAIVGSLVGCALVVVRSLMALPPADRSSGWRKRLLRGGGLVGTVLSAMMMLSLALPQQANSLDWTFGMGDKMVCGIVSPSTGGQPAGTGPEAVVASHNMTGLPGRDGNEAQYMDKELGFPRENLDGYTLYEVSGLRGLRFVNWVKDEKGENTNCVFQAWTSVSTGNFINSIGLFALQVVIFMKEFAQVQDPFRFMYEPFTPAVNTFFSIATKLFGLAYICAIIVAMWRAMKGRNLQQSFEKVTGSLLTAFVAAIAYGGVAVASWTSPNGNGFYTFMSTLDSTAGLVNAGISNEVLQTVPQSEYAMCKKPDGGDVVSEGQRYSSCLLAETLAYQPWALATFGPAASSKISPSQEPMMAGGGMKQDGEKEGAKSLPCYNAYDGCSDLRTYLISQVGGPDYHADMNKCLDSNGYDPEANEVDNIGALKVCEPYHAVANDLMVKASDSADPNGSLTLASYRANAGGSTHITHSFYSLLGVLTVGLGIAYVAGATIYWHGRLLMLFVMGLFILGLGAFRSFDDTRKWIGNVTQTVIARAIYGFLTTILIYLVSLISVLQAPAGHKLILLAILVFASLKALRKVDEVSSIGVADQTGADRMIGKFNVFSGSAMGTVAGNVATGGLKALGSGGLRIAGAAGRGAGRGGEFVSRPVRGQLSQTTGRVQASLDDVGGRMSDAVRGYAGLPPTRSTSEPETQPRGPQSDGTQFVAPGPTSRPGRDAPPQQEKPGTQQEKPGTQEPKPLSRRQRVVRGFVNGGDKAKDAVTDIRGSFERPTSRTRERARAEQEVFIQEKRERIQRAWEEKRDVPGFREKREIRRSLRRLQDEELLDQNKHLTADQRAARLAQLRRQDRK